MENMVEGIEQQTKRIQSNINEIGQKLSNINKPIFVELLGTPKSGKTTLVTYLKQLFEKNNIPYEIKQETAEYNPIENKRTEEYEMWMIMEIMKNISEDISQNSGKVIVYDRGMLDRIPWIDFHVQWGSIPLNDSILLKQWYSSEFLSKYRPLTYGLITSPELSIERKGRPGRVVNKEYLESYNGCLNNEYDSINKCSSKYTTLQTDEYQGKLEAFIMDMIEKVTTDISEITRRFELDALDGKTQDEER